MIGRATAFLLALVLGAAPAFAQQAAYADPRDVVDAYYSAYGDINYDSNDSVLRSEAFEALVRRNNANNLKQLPRALDFDPFLGAYAGDFGGFTIGDIRTVGERAEVEVAFVNDDVSGAVTVELVFERDGWRIDDVVSDMPGHEYRMTDLYEAGFARAEQALTSKSN